MAKKQNKSLKKILTKILPIVGISTTFFIASCTPLGAVSKIVQRTLEIGQSNPWDQELDATKPLDSIITGKVALGSNLKASDFLKQYSTLDLDDDSNSLSRRVSNSRTSFLNSAILWTFIPGVDNLDLNAKFDLKITPITNSANDFYGSIKVKVDSYNKDSQTLVQSKELVINGFETDQTGIYAYKERINTAFEKIETLELKNQSTFDINSLKSDSDIWEHINLPSNFEKIDITKLKNSDEFDVPDQPQSVPNIQDIAKNPYRLKVKNFYYLKATILKDTYDSQTGNVDVVLSIYHDQYHNYVSKIVKLKVNSTQGLKKLTEIKSFKLKEEYSNFLPSFLINSTENSGETLSKYIDFGGLDYKNYDIKKVPSLSNDQNGDFYLILNSKENDLTSGPTSPGQIIKVEGFNSYDKIFASSEFTSQINFDFIDSWYKLPTTTNVSEKLKNISQSLNSSGDALLWPLFGQAVKKTLLEPTLFKNTAELTNFEKLNYDFASFTDFKISESGVSFYFGNSVQDYYKINVKFTNTRESKNIIEDFGAKVLEKNIINDSLRSRSMVIQLRSNAFDPRTNSNTTRITSGTAWVFDRKLQPDPENPGKFLPTNTYYLATNLHVISDLINKPDQIYSFSYLLDGNLTNLNEISFDDTNLFRRFDRISKTEGNRDFLPPEGFQYINSESKKFWNNLKINPIGLDMPDRGKFRDIAIIEVTFPEDEHKNNPFNFGIPFLDRNFFGRDSYIKNVPDAVRYYNEAPLDVLVTNKFVPTFTKGTQLKTSKIESALPLHAYLGGFLGGFTWITDNKNSFVTINELQKDNQFKQDNSLKSFQGATSISLPGLRGGRGMSGSLVVNEYNQVIGIFWGGYFPQTAPGRNPLVKGIGQFDPIGVKIDNNPTVLAKWLAQTQDIQTDLDQTSQKVFSLEDPAQIERLAHSARWLKFSNGQNSQTTPDV
ncbi:DUF31 family putative serine protease [Mesomycoplasma ovipneumoniae]|uniref:DUF31 family putative serine protease n=1 Tax=Mesomycoplasma ovipneumoniae TaxID=29562 RepID=UPI00296562B2|nr:hypothetical protein [Mesomycoplasma ovipneumoniae]MDW2834452.1 hypothetical protein [Mesomycoplasma ovipneumoniae]